MRQGHTADTQYHQLTKTTLHINSIYVPEKQLPNLTAY